MSDDNLSPAAEKRFRMFSRSLPLRMKLQETARSLGDVNGLSCLEIGTHSGAMSYHLRRLGGKWDTVVTDEKTAAAVRAVVPDDVYVFEGQALPFKKKSFDAVVIVDSLERIQADDEFIEECHKILKPDGKLVVNVQNVKTWSAISLLRRLLGLTHERKGLVRPGYTESDLFNILKHGFDLQGVRSFSRFFVELTDAFVQFIENRLRNAPEGSEGRIMALYSMARPLYWLADQIDMLLMFNRGHHLIVTAKRRAWRPRKAPVLVDGRSLTEAVLSKALD